MGFLTKANERRKVGKSGIANALRDGKACDGEARNQVRPKEPQSVIWEPLEDWNKVLHPFNDPSQWLLLILELPERIIGEERFLQPGFEFREKPSLG